MAEHAANPRQFPVAAGLLFGLGLGGFFDGIVLHQILQWHHMLTNTGDHPAGTVAGLEDNTFADGLFHAATWICLLVGILLLRRAWAAGERGPSARVLAGTMLAGWGLFNLVEGLVDHHLLGIHHVNETAPRGHWIYWDLAFLAWGAGMLVGGWFILEAGRRETRSRAAAQSAQP